MLIKRTNRWDKFKIFLCGLRYSLLHVVDGGGGGAQKPNFDIIVVWKALIVCG